VAPSCSAHLDELPLLELDRDEPLFKLLERLGGDLAILAGLSRRALKETARWGSGWRAGADRLRSSGEG
jgi:hypothetical protein